MEINYLFLIWIFFAHWLIDFVFQTNGDKKHNNWEILLWHTITYSGLMGLAYYSFTGEFLDGMNFAGVTFVFHTLTDIVTSKWNHKQLVAKKYKLWMNSIGFDQFLHHAQILLTICLLQRL